MSRIGLDSWNESARQYDSFERKWNFYGTVAAELIRQLPIRPDSRVLELACGTGACTLKLARAAPTGQVLALDFSEGMVRVARENLSAAGLTNVEVVRGAAEDVSLLASGRRFDVTACNSAFWHFPEPDRVLSGLRQVMTRDGVFALSLPSWVERSPEAREAFRAKLGEVLQKYGVTPPQLQKLRSQRPEFRMDYSGTFARCGFELTESTFEFRVSQESRDEWRRISAFADGDRWFWLSLVLDSETQKKVSEELSAWRRDHFPRDTTLSTWRIMVARPNAGWTPP